MQRRAGHGDWGGAGRWECCWGSFEGLALSYVAVAGGEWPADAGAGKEKDKKAETGRRRGGKGSGLLFQILGVPDPGGPRCSGRDCTVCAQRESQAGPHGQAGRLAHASRRIEI